MAPKGLTATFDFHLVTRAKSVSTAAIRAVRDLLGRARPCPSLATPSEVPPSARPTRIGPASSALAVAQDGPAHREGVAERERYDRRSKLAEAFQSAMPHNRDA